MLGSAQARLRAWRAHLYNRLEIGLVEKSRLAADETSNGVVEHQNSGRQFLAAFQATGFIPTILPRP
jgi:hypothetical protein